MTNVATQSAYRCLLQMSLLVLVMSIGSLSLFCSYSVLAAWNSSVIAAGSDKPGSSDSSCTFKSLWRKAARLWCWYPRQGHRPDTQLTGLISNRSLCVCWSDDHCSMCYQHLLFLGQVKKHLLLWTTSRGDAKVQFTSTEHLYLQENFRYCTLTRDSTYTKIGA